MLDSTNQPIQARTVKALELQKLQQALARHAVGSASRLLCLDLQYFDERIIVEKLLQETAEAVALHELSQPLPIERLEELDEVIARLKTGSTLSGLELWAIYKTLKLARLVQLQLKSLDKEEFTALPEFEERLFVLKDIAEAIELAIDQDGSVKDSASHHLANLRGDLQRLESNIKETLNKIIRTKAKSLQETIFTQRNGRYVLPVESSQRHEIAGLIHDTSSSGLTIFIEPMAVVELSNKLRMVETAIQHEIERILTELSALVFAQKESLESTYDTLVQLDFINARAKFALSYQGVRPQISKQFYIKGLSHPLLYLQFKGTDRQVIPSNFILDDNVLSVIISGPNTGGKTVFLKSVGLSSYMLKAGLFVAAFEAKLPLFSQILADIGDEQSLEQNLSTFSSHMTNIIEVINLARSDTLIILDEIGAGTDPKEGSALAQALLGYLKERKALTITSTHYSEIKAIAYKDPGYINASLSFDETTLTPTYKLYLGQPGSSKGITIAKRLGLKDAVVEAAKSLIDADAIYLDEVSRELEAKLKEVSAKEEQLQNEIAQSEKLQSDLQAELEELRYEKLKFKAQLKQKLKDELKEAETFVKDTIAQLQKGPTMQSAQSLQKQVKEKVAQINNMDDEAEIQSQTSSSNFNIGAKVKIKSLRQTGNVLAVIGDKQNPAELIYEIQAGSFKVKVKADDLEAYMDNVDSQALNTKLKKKLAKLGLGSNKVRSRTSSKASNQVVATQLGDVFVRSSENTLDLRGKRVDESMTILDQFLNEAVLSNLHSVMIIHGHGTGAVKSAVRQALDSFNQLESYRPGENYEGGDGVTVVFF